MKEKEIKSFITYGLKSSSDNDSEEEEEEEEEEEKDFRENSEYFMISF